MNAYRDIDPAPQSRLMRCLHYLGATAMNKAVESVIGVLFILIATFFGFQKWVNPESASANAQTTAVVAKTPEVEGERIIPASLHSNEPIIGDGNIGYRRESRKFGLSSELVVLQAGEQDPPFTELFHGIHSIFADVHAKTKEGGLFGVYSKKADYLVNVELKANFNQTSFGALLRDGEENFVSKLLLDKIRASANAYLLAALKKAEKEDVPSPKPTVEKVESETPSEPSPNAEEASEPELAEARPYLGQMMEESLSSALNSEFGLQDLRIIVHTIRKLSAAEIKSDEVSSFEHASSDTLSRNVLSAPNFSLSSGKAATHIAFPAIVGLALIATVLIRVFAD